MMNRILFHSIEKVSESTGGLSRLGRKFMFDEMNVLIDLSMKTNSEDDEDIIGTLQMISKIHLDEGDVSEWHDKFRQNPRMKLWMKNMKNSKWMITIGFKKRPDFNSNVSDYFDFLMMVLQAKQDNCIEFDSETGEFHRCELNTRRFYKVVSMAETS